MPLSDFLRDEDNPPSERLDKVGESGRGGNGATAVTSTSPTPIAPARFQMKRSAAKKRQREMLKAFVGSIWENILMVVSQLLLHCHAAANAANAANATANAAAASSSMSSSAVSSGSGGGGNGGVRPGRGSHWGDRLWEWA